MSELLGPPRVRGLRDAREREATALVAAVAAAGASPVNLSDMVAATSSRIVRRVAFGDGDGDESMDVKAVLNETQALLGGLWVADYVPWLRWVDTLSGKRWRLERRFRQLDALYERVIDDHLNKRKHASDEEDDLVDVLLRLHGDPAHRSTFGSRSHIKGILTDMFIAGSDTSAVTVQWAMTELVRNPDVLAKAQHEVRRVVAAGDKVREADLPELHYLRLVIKETLRLHPAAPLLVPRETTEPFRTAHGVEIPARTRVVVNAMAIHTDPGVWGPDAERFVPERHRDDADGCAQQHDGFALVPFGIGRRRCPGVHFAAAAVELLLANLLFCFDWRAPPGRELDVEEENGLAVHKKNPLVLIATKSKRNTATRLSYGQKNISFAPDGAYWRAARRACMSALLGAPRVRELRDAREREAAALIAAVAAAGASPVNLSDMVAATSSRIVRRVALGDGDGDESMDVKAVLDETQALLGGLWVADYVSWLRWVDTLSGKRRRLERRFRQLDALYERVIDDHINKRKRASDEEDDLADVLLRLHGDPAHRSTFGSRTHIKGILTDMFIAGSDTSAVTVQWAMTELVRNPDVLAKAQHEVRRVVAAAGGGDKDGAMVREADLPELHYLRLVIKETLRLHPASPLVQRETTEPFRTAHGVEIPARTRVVINAMAIHTDPGVWGPDAERFVPERHRAHDADGGQQHDGFALVPFGIGRRSCCWPTSSSASTGARRRGARWTWRRRTGWRCARRTLSCSSPPRARVTEMVVIDDAGM
ncbi:hypothetical protein OsI_16338 [Oryza sativa Indica Group]|uniref:Uncharacterized protein n=1 Tax=Oryza sativa subsp. indica TaxID=39946 RepID=A2XUQ0_ORYSI|nr:hypothetical protein OsI_16338 [Oryza sativa Indica Group]